MLTGVQKLKLAKQLKTLRADIKSPAMKGIAKIKLAKEIKNIRSQIKGTINNVVSRLEQLMNGKFNDLEPKEFIELVTDIERETGEFELLKQPVIKYVEKNLAA